MVSDPYAYRHGLRKGDTVRLRTDKGPREFPVAGVYYDYSSDQGVVAILGKTHDLYWEDRGVDSIGLRLSPGVPVDEAVGRIRGMLGDRPAVVRSNRALKEASLKVFDRTFGVTNVLRALTVLIAFVGVLNALMAIQMERGREHAVMRAIGLTPMQAFGLIAGESAVMGASRRAASPSRSGSAQALVLIQVINRRSFGWTMQTVIDPWILLQAVALALAASVLAGLYPAARLARSSPAARAAGGVNGPPPDRGDGRSCSRRAPSRLGVAAAARAVPGAGPLLPARDRDRPAGGGRSGRVRPRDGPPRVPVPGRPRPPPGIPPRVVVLHRQPEGPRRAGGSATSSPSSASPSPRRALPPRGSRWGAGPGVHGPLLRDRRAGERGSATSSGPGAAPWGSRGAGVRPFRVWIDDWSAEGGTDSLTPIRLRAAEDGTSVDLVLDSDRPPVPQGDRGLSRKGAAAGNASHYYSMTRLATRGTVRVDGASYAVEGNSWLDREWGTSALGKEHAGWDWFALQLSDGRDLMFYRLRRRDGGADPFSAGTLARPDGSFRPLSAGDVGIETLDHWKSPSSGARYPSRWRLRVPSEGIDLEVVPRVADQELRTFVRYWEGAVSVRGDSRGKPVEGEGYVELTGYGETTGR